MAIRSSGSSTLVGLLCLHRPASDGGTFPVGRLRGAALSRIAVPRDLQGRVSLEAGEGSGQYLRGTAEGQWLAQLGPTKLVSRIYAGVGTEALPAYRSFVLGGRGTLVGEPFRAYGGREMAWAQVEWRFEVPVPALSLGSYASTGRRLTVAPFLSAGYSARSYGALPWTRTEGIRPVAGLAFEWLMGLIRIETGVGLRNGHVGVTVDVNRDWWGLL